MERRNFLKTTALTAASLALMGKRGFASILDDPAYQFKTLRNNVGMFAEKGGTIAWMINKEGIVVVDAEFPEQATHLIGLLKKQSDLPFEWLINTHHHGDHTSGNISFKGIVNHVAAHSNSLINQQRVAKEQKKEDQQLYPDLTYGDTWEYKKLKEKINAYYYGAGHTNGDSIIHFPHANIAHMGDLVFNRRWAFIDRSAGASVKNWIVVLEKAQQQFDKDTLFVFGHAFDPDKVTGYKEDLKAMQDYLSNMLDFVNKEIKAGKTREEIIKTTAIPGVTEWKGDGIERGLQATYDELIQGVI